MNLTLLISLKLFNLTNILSNSREIIEKFTSKIYQEIVKIHYDFFLKSF